MNVMIRSICVVIALWMHCAVSQAATVNIRFASTEGLALHAWSLDQFELRSLTRNRLLFKGDAREWKVTGGLLSYPPGEYEFTLRSQFDYEDTVRFTIRDPGELVNLYTAYSFNFTGERRPWALPRPIEPGVAVQHWSRSDAPEFAPITQPGAVLGQIRQRASFRPGSDTLTLGDQFSCAARLPKGLFVVSAESVRLNGVLLRAGSTADGVRNYPTGVVSVHSPSGLVWTLLNLDTGALVTQFPSCDGPAIHRGISEFKSGYEFTLPVGRYRLVTAVDEREFTLKDGERLSFGE